MTTIASSNVHTAPHPAVPAHLARVAVLIPARRMEAPLAPMVLALSMAGVGAIVVVSDGMNPTELIEFEQLELIPRVHLLRHAVNLGKGRGLKTGINYILNELICVEAVITADADGQHTVRDIESIALEMQQHPSGVVLGCRSFTGSVPLRSRIGNELTRHIFHFFSSRPISDTQTGLRGFPVATLPELLALPGERYEYEMTVLAQLSRRGAPLIERPIETIYLDGNRSSHFQPLRDSMRIYFVLVRFYGSSIISAGLDLVCFSIAFWATHQLLISVCVGRLSSIANFALNRSLVFRSRTPFRKTLSRYYLLAILLACLSYEAIDLLTSRLGWNVIPTKILVEVVLSLLSFSAQTTLVFGQED